MTVQDPGDKGWWGTFDVPVGTALQWQIGSLSLWVARRAEEWRICHQRSDDAMSEALSFAGEDLSGETPWPETLERFCTRGSSPRLRLQPVLADRAVMSRTVAPLNVLPGEEVTVYVSSPVWVRILAGTNDTFLHELPSFRPSDTWFGSPTGDGELSYANRSFSRLELEEVPQRPHRALSAVRVRNHARDALRLTSLNLPAPRLHLYASASGALWTESITVERDQGAKLAKVITSRGAPQEMGEAQLIAKPREEAAQSVMARVFSGLFAARGGETE